MQARVQQRSACAALLIFALVALAPTVLCTRAARAAVFIMLDGLVLPDTAPIDRDGDTYTLTGDIAGPLIIYKSAIAVDGAGHTLDATEESFAIYVYGGYGATDLVISNFNIQGGNVGILLHDTHGNTISGNTVSGVGSHGIHVTNSSNNAIEDNVIYLSPEYGIHLQQSHGNTIAGNTISESGYDGIWLYNSNGNTIIGNTSSGSVSGIYMGGNSSTNTITLNAFSSNDFGAYLYKAHSNTIAGNTISGNIVYGIYIYQCSSNILYHNNFMDNGWHVVLIQSDAQWDNGGGEGNYWDNYVGVDTDGDGIGDTKVPHMDVDFYPLMEPWSLVPTIDDVIKDIEGMDLPAGIENSLLSKLDNALKSLNKGQGGAAVNQLQAFIRQVEAQAGKKISQQDADALIADVQAIIDDILA